MANSQRTEQLKKSQRSLQSVETDPESKYEISVLPVHQQRFVQLYMTGQYSIRQLAEILDYNPQTLSKWMRDENVAGVIQRMQEDIHNQVSSQLKSLTVHAVTRLSNLVDSKVDGVALQAVNTILDRAGHRSKQEININKTVTTFEEKMSNLLEDVDIEDLEEVEELEEIVEYDANQSEEGPE